MPRARSAQDRKSPSFRAIQERQVHRRSREEEKRREDHDDHDHWAKPVLPGADNPIENRHARPPRMMATCYAPATEAAPCAYRDARGTVIRDHSLKVGGRPFRSSLAVWGWTPFSDMQRARTSRDEWTKETDLCWPLCLRCRIHWIPSEAMVQPLFELLSMAHS
jgi:hypothetical protein